MQTRQKYMRAVFTNRADNAINMASDKELISDYRIIDKKTERTIVTCAVYRGKSRSASAVHASLWVHGITDANKPESWEYGETSGRGSAGGYGYHKASAAVASAISSAGIELYGSPYGHPVNGDSPAKTRAMLKSLAHIGGCGSSSIECALLAIAYAAGFNNCIFVR